MADPSGKTTSQPKSDDSATQPGGAARQSTSQSKRKRVAEDLSSGGGEQAADAAGQDDGTGDKGAELRPKRARGRRTSETTRMAQQSKDWGSFQVMCNSLRRRHSIIDHEELTDIWEQLDNCLRKTGVSNDTWYLRCKGGQQHSTICRFVAEWQARKGSTTAHNSPERESTSEAGEQATLHAASKRTSSLAHHDSVQAASDLTHSKEHQADGSSSHRPSQNAKSSVCTGELDSNAASAGPSCSTWSGNSKESQQVSSAAGSGSSATKLPAAMHSGPSTAITHIQQPGSHSAEPIPAATDMRQFPEPKARPLPTSQTRSAADVHKQSPGKLLAFGVCRQQQRKGDSLLCLVPKTSTARAENVTSSEVSGQAMLEPTASAELFSKPAQDQAPISTPTSSAPGAVPFPFKLHCSRGLPANVGDACAGSSGSSEQALQRTEQASLSAQKAGDPTSVDPTSGDPTSGDPTSVDLSTVDPSTVDPSAVDPTSVDPSNIKISMVEATCVAATIVHKKGMTAQPEASQHVVAEVAANRHEDAAEAMHQMLAGARLAESPAQLLEQSPAAPGLVGKSTGDAKLLQHSAGPSCADVFTTPLNDDAEAEVPAWKAAYKIAIQSEANRWRLYSHQEAILKGKKRLAFLDSKLTSRRLVQAKLVDCHDDPICDFVRESLDTWTTAKQQTHQELADHLQAVSSAYEHLEKYRCATVAMLKDLPLP